MASLVAPAVQRDVEIDEMTTSVAGSGAAPSPGAGGGPAGGPVTSDGGNTTVTGGHIALDAPMVEAPGVVRADTIIANSVVAASYTPGAGNEW